MRNVNELRAAARRQAGMSVVEILVGLLIGMIGVVVIFSVLALAESQKRTTTAGSDAQTAGAIATYALERDLRMAGYGFGAAAVKGHLGCAVAAHDTKRGAAFTLDLVPVKITQGAAGAPDTLRVLWGASPQLVTSQTFTTNSLTTKYTQGRAGFLRGDLVVAAGAGGCVLTEITYNGFAGYSGTPPVPVAVSPADDGATIKHEAVAYKNEQNKDVTAQYNSGAGMTFGVGGGFLYNLGPRDAARWNLWQIRGGSTLTVSDELHYADANGDGADDWIEVGENIIDLQAQYGIDADGNGILASGEWQDGDPADWGQLRAVRVALLARSAQWEKDAVTPAAPAWSGGPFAVADPADGTSWKNYRYRVYEIVVPLRNIIWSTAP
jgi:type IV pilus assembly protein PilW